MSGCLLSIVTYTGTLSRPSLWLMVLLAIMVGGCGGSDEDGTPPPMDPEVERLLYEGTQALRRHQFDQAVRMTDSAAARHPDAADVLFLRGRIFAELARLDSAEKYYRRALEERPAYPGAWHNLGNTAFREQKYSEAVRRYRRELEEHTDPRPWRGIARAYVELGKTDSARHAFDQALAIDSTFAQAHFGRALLLEDLGRVEEALDAAERALAHAPDNLEYRYQVGAYLNQVGRPAEALDHLRAVAEEWPWHQGTHYNMGQALMRVGRAEEARRVQEQAERLRELQAQISHHENTVRVQPTDPYAHAGLGGLLRRAGRYNDAMHAYQVALFLEPSNLDIRNNVAVLHLLRQDTTAAIRSFEQIVHADSSRSHAWINLGSLYAMSGERDRARAAWRTALEVDPGNEMARRSLAGLPD